MSFSPIFAAVSGAVLAVTAFAASPASALDLSDFYIRTDTGWSKSRDPDFKQDNPGNLANCFLFDANGVTCNSSLHNLSDSAVLGGGVGYRFTDSIRGDVTLTYRGGYQLNEPDPALTFYKADVTSLAFMVSGFYDFPAIFEGLRPFVGFGIGFSNNNLDDIAFNCGPGCAGTIPGGSTTSFAWQGMAGLSYQLFDWAFIDAGYRYFDGGEFTKDAGFSATWGGTTDSATGNLRAHELMLVLRVPLGSKKPMPMPVAQAAPPPPPRVAPPPPPPMAQQAPSQYVVFFDWNSTVLSDQAKNIIRTAAQAARQGRVARIEVTGHADRSGSDSYNMGISDRRARVVQAELVKDGVSAGDIVSFAKGESDPLVPTADGVREPQNRRVQIVFPGQGRPGS